MQVLVFLMFLTITFPGCLSRVKGPVPNGIYKVTNVADGSALTATREPGPNGARPWKVITSFWTGSEEQEWKVKTKFVDGTPFEIIRNEKIRDNEVTKEVNFDTAINKNNYIQINWNLITVGSGRVQGYELNSGEYCLKSNGQGQEVQHATCIDSGEENVDRSYLWTFEKLSDIPSNDPSEQFE